MNRKQKRIYKFANRKFNRAFAKSKRLSKKQERLIKVMKSANDVLHMLNEELKERNN